MCHDATSHLLAQAHRGQQVIACYVSEDVRVPKLPHETCLPPSAWPKPSSLVLQGFRCHKSSAIPPPWPSGPVGSTACRLPEAKDLGFRRQASQRPAASLSHLPLAETLLRSSSAGCCHKSSPASTFHEENSLACRQRPVQTPHHSPMSSQTKSTTLRHAALESTPRVSPVSSPACCLPDICTRMIT